MPKELKQHDTPIPPRAEPTPSKRRGAEVPPPDHERFEELRRLGFAGIRRRLEERRKKAT